MENEMNEGWKCPVCNSVYAPFVLECEKCNNKDKECHAMSDDEKCEYEETQRKVMSKRADELFLEVEKLYKKDVANGCEKTETPRCMKIEGTANTFPTPVVPDGFWEAFPLVSYIAMSKEGEWYGGYKTPLIACDAFWKCFVVIDSPWIPKYTGKWQDSLLARPEESKEKKDNAWIHNKDF
jgi:hypothetical protein